MTGEEHPTENSGLGMEITTMDPNVSDVDTCFAKPVPLEAKTGTSLATSKPPTYSELTWEDEGGSLRD